MKLLVFAYHDIGYECLKFLLEAGEEIAAVVTHEDDPNEEVWFRSVAELARRHRLPFFAPSNPNVPRFVDRMRGLAPDLIFSFYYRRILSKDLLAVAGLGAINLHGSLLPRYRGRCPVNWVLIHGESETGVTLHHMIEKADAGDVIAQKRVAIGIEDTALTLFRGMTVAARDLLAETLPLIKAGMAPRLPQDERLATTFRGRRPEDGKIEWDQPATAIHNLIRAVTHPYPGAFTFCGDRKLTIWKARVNIHSVAQRYGFPGEILATDGNKGILVNTGQGNLLVTQAQLEGEQEMTASELMQRYDISVGTRLGERRVDCSVSGGSEGEAR